MMETLAVFTALITFETWDACVEYAHKNNLYKKHTADQCVKILAHRPAEVLRPRARPVKKKENE